MDVSRTALRLALVASLLPVVLVAGAVDEPTGAAARIADTPAVSRGASAAAPPSDTAPRIRVLARVPDPGSVALTVVGRGGRIYGGSYFPAAGNAGDGTPSVLFEWSRAGTLLRQWTITGQDLSVDHGIQASAVDRAGRIYLPEASRGVVLRFDPRTGEQVVYGRLPDLPACSPFGGATDAEPCTDTLLDQGPDPDYAVWGRHGDLYVTDVQQAAVFRIPAGGGTARLWATSPLMDGIAFGPTGAALSPDRRALYVSTVASRPGSAGIGDPTAGALLRFPLADRGQAAGAPEIVWRSGSAELPDGLAFAADGTIYLALLGPLAHQVVVLDPDGKEQTRFPGRAENLTLPVPFDTPSSAVFDRCRLLITNDSYIADDPDHQVIFAVRTGRCGAPVRRPAAAVVEPDGTIG